MNAKKIFQMWLAVAGLAPCLQGCTTLAAPPMMMISMASTIVGGVANGAIMGGSTVGVIRNVAFGDSAGDEPGVAAVQATVRLQAKTVADSRDVATPQFASGLARACYFPNASGRGLPCT